MLSRSIRSLAWACALALAAAPALAQKTYKWVDKDGRVQYSDKPPPGANAQPLESRIGAVSGGTTTASAARSAATVKGPPPTIAEQDQAFRKRRIEEAERAQKQAKAEEQARQKSEACSNARSRLASLEAGGRQRRFDAKGEPTFLDDAQIEAEKRQARSDVGSYCAG